DVLVCRRVEADDTGRLVVLEGLGDPLVRDDSVEDATEAVLLAAGSAVDVVVAPARPRVVLDHLHLILARSEPLGDELRIGCRTEELRGRRVEVADDVDDRATGLRRDGRGPVVHFSCSFMASRTASSRRYRRSATRRYVSIQPVSASSPAGFRWQGLRWPSRL